MVALPKKRNHGGGQPPPFPMVMEGCNQQQQQQRHPRIRRGVRSWRLCLVAILAVNLLLLSGTLKVWERYEGVGMDDPMHSPPNRLANGQERSNLHYKHPLQSWKQSQSVSSRRQQSKVRVNSTNNENHEPTPPSLGSLTIKTTTTTTTTTTTLSACLLIKDDNPILSEWIAYHYHAWNLRQLIVAVDPSSMTSPDAILTKWKTLFGLDYELWNDADFLPDFFVNGNYELVPKLIKFQDWNSTTKWRDSIHQTPEQLQQKLIQINNHRYRQAKFLQHCARHIQQQQQQQQYQGRDNDETTTKIENGNRPIYQPSAARWVIHIDTDEYMTLNPTTFNKTVPSSPVIWMQQDVYSSGGGLLQFLEQAINQSRYNLVNWPCISMPRILYGSQEDDDDDDDSTTTSTNTVTSRVLLQKQGWNRDRFESLRWKYHAPLDDTKANKQPKVIMDVTGFPPINTTRRVFSIHRPSLHLCRMNSQMRISDVKRYPIIVRHFLGSYERYMSRQDPRRTRALYLEAQGGGNSSNTDSGSRTDLRDDIQDGIDQWLPSFVATHGIEKVSHILAEYRGKQTVVDERMGPAAAVSKGDLVMEEGAKDEESMDNTTPMLSKPLKLGILLPLEDDSLSACLLIKDDNDILPEWLAYHYHVLKLRTLVVAVDPNSKTSPAVVLEAWQDLMDDIQIWEDSDYMPSFFLNGEFEQIPNIMGNMTDGRTSIYLTNSTRDETTIQEDPKAINIHRFRQNVFLTECIKNLKYQHNRTWTMHIDTDEYISLHPKIRTMNHWRQLSIDPTLRKDSLFRLLKQAASEYTKVLSYPCISLPRLIYGSKEDLEDDRFPKLPAGFNGSRFETLRWKYHSNYDQDQQLNGKPTTILDLSGLPPAANFLRSSSGAYSMHRPALHLCQSDRKVLFDAPFKFPLTIQHYIGSWERYSRRADARRSRAMYDSKAMVDAGKDDGWIDGWVASFVTEHGEAVAQRLLGTYTVKHYNADGTEGDSVLEAKEWSNTGQTNRSDALRLFQSSQTLEFSACLLIKDDNEILNEWIAYHYHVLGLRCMIVAVDSTSITSPTGLLDQWRSFGMTIEEWQDTDFMPDSYFQKAYHLQPRLVKIKKNKEKWLEGVEDPKVKEDYVNSIQDHRFRQITFLSCCAKKLRNLGRTWMIHIDTDEYVVVNPTLRKEGRFGKGKNAIEIPRTAEESIVPRLLNKMVTNSWSTINYPCISLPRLLFGSFEGSDPPSAFPNGYNQSRFESLRWKYHCDFDNSALNKQPKVIMDVSAISSLDKMFVDGRVFSVHRPSQELCRTQGQMNFENTEDFPFSINHYLGTFERFGSRRDLRRNKKLYDQKANVRAGKDDDRWVDSWLPSFIKRHGDPEVSRLLRDYLST